MKVKSKYSETRKKYYKSHKDNIAKYHKRWSQVHPKYTLKQYQEKYYCGLNDEIYKRDNWCCQECGMTQEQHILIFNRNLTIHHIDGNGRYSKFHNNLIDNLITLCLRCHGKKHGRPKSYKIERRKL